MDREKETKVSQEYNALKLENLLCFPLYACARELIKLYKPFLDQIDLTYTQYITMIVLWEKESLTSKELGQKLFLDSGTLTPLLKNKAYLIFLGFTLLFYVAASCEANFIPYFMEQSGVSPDTYGVVLAFRAFLEIPFLLLMVRLRRKFPLRVLVAAATGLMALECLGFGLFVQNLPTMLVFCTFFGLGNGLFIGSSLNYVYELAPDNLKATAQAFYASISSVAGILGNILGGLSFDALGAKTFYLCVMGVYLLAVGVFVLSFLLPKRKHPAQTAES